MFVCKWRHRRKAEVEWCARRTARLYPNTPAEFRRSRVFHPIRQNQDGEKHLMQETKAAQILTLCVKGKPKKPSSLFHIPYSIHTTRLRPSLLPFSPYFFLPFISYCFVQFWYSSFYFYYFFYTLLLCWGELVFCRWGEQCFAMSLPNHFLLVLRETCISWMGCLAVATVRQCSNKQYHLFPFQFHVSF